MGLQDEENIMDNFIDEDYPFQGPHLALVLCIPAFIYTGVPYSTYPYVT